MQRQQHHYVPAQTAPTHPLHYSQPVALGHRPQRIATTQTLEAQQRVHLLDEQSVRIFYPTHDPKLHRQPYLAAPGPPVPTVRTIIPTKGGGSGVALDLSHHAAATATTTGKKKKVDWEQMAGGPQSRGASLPTPETLKREREEQAKQQQSYELRQRRVQSARNVANKILPKNMSAVDYEGGIGELTLEVKAREIWMTVRDGLRLALIVFGVCLVVWFAAALFMEYGAETRMMAQLTGADSLHRPALLSSLDPNHRYVSAWVRRHFPPFFGRLSPESVTKGLDSVVRVSTVVDPSEWGMGNWLSRLLGRLFFHRGPRRIEQNMSMRDLDLAMRQAARETKLSCLCAAHVGVPVHAVLCRDTFMMEPVLERASTRTEVARIRDEVLMAGGDDDITVFEYSALSHVDYISKTGRKVRGTMDDASTRCVTYCTLLAKRSGGSSSE